MITCSRCGKENQDHYKFCLGCGAELSAPPAQGGAGDMAMMKTMMADVGSVDGGDGPGDPDGPTAPVSSPAAGMPSAQHPNSPTPPGGGVRSGGLPGVSPAPVSGSIGALGNADTAGALPGVGVAPQGMGGAPSPGMGGAPLPGMGAPAHQTPQSMGAPPPGPSAAQPVVAGIGAPQSPQPSGPPPGVPTGTAGASAPAPADGTRPCPSCGATVAPAFRFCGACGHHMTDESGPADIGRADIGRATADFAQQRQPAAQPAATMTLIRPDGSEGGTHTLKQGENTIGREFGAIFEQDGYLSPSHAELIVNAAGAVIRDLESLNGVFVKMTDEEVIEPGQIVRVGQELLRFDTIEPPEPTEDGTEVMGSPNPGFWGKITVIIGNHVDGSAFPLLGDSVTLGRERGDINFPDDGYVSGLHARLFTRDGKVYLNDLGSSNGTFIKVQGERALGNLSFVLLGQQLFRLQLSV